MNEIITRWDWVSLGIVIGVATTLISQTIQKWITAKFVKHELQLKHALAQDILKMKEKIEA